MKLDKAWGYFSVAALLCPCFTMAAAQTPHMPKAGSAERRAICDAARAFLVSKYASGTLPQPIVFKIDHLLVKDRFCNMEAVPLFKDGSNLAPKYVADIAFNFCLGRNGNSWRVVTDLSRCWASMIFRTKSCGIASESDPQN